MINQNGNIFALFTVHETSSDIIYFFFSVVIPPSTLGPDEKWATPKAFFLHEPFFHSAQHGVGTIIERRSREFAHPSFGWMNWSELLHRRSGIKKHSSWSTKWGKKSKRIKKYFNLRAHPEWDLIKPRLRLQIPLTNRKLSQRNCSTRASS